ncbi:MAG: hypothetical protein RJQ01_10605 [Microcella sp.]|uniref:hypothetical protein n=1 Tax=Microcella sp. TaxID=1913979 RepID=UPI00331480F7
MRRAPLVWGGAAAALAGLGAGVLAILISTATTPEAHAERYLQALAADDLVTASRLAGLPEGTPTPLGDAGEPSVLAVLGRIDRGDGRVAIIAEYGGLADAATVILTLAPAEPLLGVIPQWSFETPPVRSLEVGVDQHDEFVVNDVRLASAAAGETARLTGFVPARLDIGVADPFVDAAPRSLRLTASAPRLVVLEAEPTARLERGVLQEVTAFLLGCVEQEVLQPTGCPFGRSIDDRVLGLPEWQLVREPVITLSASSTPGTWEMRALAEVGLRVTVQRLFDGRISDVDTTLTATVTGEVVMRDGTPRLTIAPPAG